MGEQLKLFDVPSKWCSGCKKEHPTGSFSKRSASADGLAYVCKEYARHWQRAFLKENPGYSREKGRESYARNKEKHKQRQQQWLTKNRHKSRAIKRKYNASHREELKAKRALKKEEAKDRNALYYQQHMEEIKKRVRRWKEQNPVKRQISNQRRRAVEIEGDISYEDWLSLCEQYDYRCLCCGEKKKLTLDHIIPISKGGPHLIENAQPLCSPCNSKKGAQTIDFRGTFRRDIGEAPER